jgi:hypothetical protein
VNRGRRGLLAGLAAAVLAVTAGCVDLPTNSAVIKDTGQPTSNAEENVRIWPKHGPTSTDSPLSVLEGFLQTAASDEPDPGAAQQYLSGQARTTWDPKRVMVFSSERAANPTLTDSNQFVIKAVEVGEVDAEGRYTAIVTPMETDYTFHVGGDAKSGYHVDSVPPGFGIPLTQEAFRSYYTPYSVYYVNGQAKTDSMIPVPFYLRSALADQDAATQLAATLLGGAPPQYVGVAQVAVTEMHLVNVTITQAAVAQVTLTKSVQNVCTETSHALCNKLAEELLATFVGIGSISSVQVMIDQSVGPQNPIGEASNLALVMAKYHVTINAAKPSGTPDVYYLDPPAAKNDPNAGHVMFKQNGHPAGVSAQVGPATMKYGHLAFGIDGSTKSGVLALTDVNAAHLYIAAPNATAAPSAVYTGTNIRSLSWDTFGHLWFIADDAGQPKLFRLDTDVNGTPQVQPVSVQLHSGDGAIQQVSVAPDGRRIALVYTDTANALALSIGVELNPGSKSAIVDLDDGAGQPIVDGWTTISDVVWSSSLTLAVLGTQQTNEPATISEVYTDGSPVFTLPDYAAVAINPPVNASAIAWTTSGGLLAAYKNATDGSPEIAAYSMGDGGWDGAISGISPSYTY